MNEVSFEHLIYIFFLLPSLVVAFLFFQGSIKKYESANRVWGRSLNAQLSKSRLVGVFTLQLIVFSALSIALAGPRWGFQLVDIESEESDVVIAIDMSATMLARDIQPSRFEAARRKAIDIIQFLGGERVGVVVFAEDAYVFCPLTNDYQAVAEFLGSLKPEFLKQTDKSYGALLQVAGKAFSISNGLSADSSDQSGNIGRGHSKTVVLLSDGDDGGGVAESEGIDEDARQLRDAGVAFITLAVGKDQPTPAYDSSGEMIRKSGDGGLKMTTMNYKRLEQLTKLLNGNLLKMTLDESDLKRVFSAWRSDQLKASIMGGDDVLRGKKQVWNEFFWFFILLGLIALVVEAFVVPYRQVRKFRV